MDHNLLIWLHIVGLILLIFGLTNLALLAIFRGAEKSRLRLFGIITHGSGLILIFITGMQMASNLQLFKSHYFMGAKFLIWLFLGGAIILFRKRPQTAGALIALCLILISWAAYIGIFKG